MKILQMHFSFNEKKAKNQVANASVMALEFPLCLKKEQGIANEFRDNPSSIPLPTFCVTFARFCMLAKTFLNDFI